MHNAAPIGIFDSGYGGLTIFKAIANLLPHYDYVYLGDNNRAPYGNRTLETVHQYTWQCVQWFFEQGCPLVILACNTASANALRTIQQLDLPGVAPEKRVLGVIRPTAEVIGNYSKTGSIGIMGTRATVNSGSYLLEIGKFFPQLRVSQLACPMLVPIVEYGEYHSPAADYFIQQYLDTLFGLDNDIDTILLACTHYPLLMDKIVKYVPAGVQVIAQGAIVAHSLAAYLKRHTEIDNILTRHHDWRFYTTDDTTDFDLHAREFFGQEVGSQQVQL